MSTVNEIFERGAAGVLAWLAQPEHSDFQDMDVKELADICWSRARSMAKATPAEGRQWGLAALAGYETLVRHGSPAAAESAAENASALRSWKLIGNALPVEH